VDEPWIEVELERLAPRHGTLLNVQNTAVPSWALTFALPRLPCRPCFDSEIRVTAPAREGRKEGAKHIKT